MDLSPALRDRDFTKKPLRFLLSSVSNGSSVTNDGSVGLAQPLIISIS